MHFSFIRGFQLETREQITKGKTNHNKINPQETDKLLKE